MSAPGTVAELLRLGAATIGESGGRVAGPTLRPVWPGAQVAGIALTVRCPPGDNLAIHAAVARASTGTVLVVEVEGLSERGYWGEILTTAAQARGVAGIVVDAGVRDLVALERRRFPVFAPVVALAGALKLGGGAVGVPVEVGGADVHTGDWIVGDADGVVAVAASELAAVIADGQARAQREDDVMRRLEAGATTLEVLQLDDHTVAWDATQDPPASSRAQ